MFYPVRPGNRGGRDLFKWDDVRYMKYNDREQYLGVTVRAGYLDKGGKWRKGDWYIKEKDNIENEQLNCEKLTVQQQDERRIRQALGLEEREVIDEGPKLTKYEIEEITRKEEMEVDEENPTGALGLGFKLNEKAIMSQKLANDQRINYNRLEGEGIPGGTLVQDEKKQSNKQENLEERANGENPRRKKEIRRERKEKKKEKEMSKEEREKYFLELQNQIKELKERKEKKEQEKIKEKSLEMEKKEKKKSEHKSQHRRKSRSRSNSRGKHRHHHHRR